MGAVEIAVRVADERVRMFVRHRDFQHAVRSNSPDCAGGNIGDIDQTVGLNDDAPALVRFSGRRRDESATATSALLRRSSGRVIP